MGRRSQQGFALLELIVAALLVTLLAVWGAQTLANRLDDASAQANAAWMLSLRESVQRYLERYASTLALAGHGAVSGPAGYADWSRPTLAELKADALLPQGFPARTMLGGGASVRVIRQGDCPGRDCRIDALIHSNTPFLTKRSGHVSEQMVAQWLMASRGWGGWVAGGRPHVVGGAAFQYPNPPWPGEPLPAGTVALAVTHGQLRDADFLRVGDTRDPEFQGTATVQGNISTGADLHVRRYVYLGTSEERFMPCGGDGAVSREAGGGLLICRDSLWLPASRSGSGGFSTNEWWGCQSNLGTSTANPVTGGCSCPPYSAPVVISDSGPQAFPDGRTVGYLCVD
ncbi:hypothetical protein RE432_15705 [Pusillimonas sp. SM2304]|uniref:type II secretion system protein n=1 Tax=Pusillimonas sp. SM2304 TaxID=3073241 RepID=UPI002875A4B9|nr:hypothetical protein [Pusillimonas sp. SM2304]MDS1141887.1 hypothetical protein [Pusillimonas sp. SM2304]